MEHHRYISSHRSITSGDPIFEGNIISIIGRWAAQIIKSKSVLGTQGSSTCIRHVTYSINCDMDGNATINRVEYDKSTVYSISLYESTITTSDEPWFGKLKLTLSVIRLSVTARDRILRCSVPIVGTTLSRSGPIQKDKVP
ncbi:NADH-ubiquinone oxidoreductase chain 2 [Forsythia ovata]|uniref:NADH-ubiquinone oxidoreductase chain 2 n=1 Tax=Forsythia ovata TaxID=205694 RepID=A0ABD1T3F1_9LAMI